MADLDDFSIYFEANETPVFGIDLGTTNSSISVWKDGEVITIPNKSKEKTTPSCVTFLDDGVLVGTTSGTNNHEHSIFDSKRLIGQTFDSVESEIKYFPFHITKDDIGRPKFKVGAKFEAYPEEIAAIVLTSLKKDAEHSTKKEVKNVVITIPAYFNDTQREATQLAARLAQLNVLRIITEPVAAAVAFGYRKNAGKFEEESILVYDLGGGTFDVAIVSIDETGMHHVRSTNGNTRLGGSKFLDKIIDFCLKRVEAMDINHKFTDDEICLLRIECEKAKKALSERRSYKIMVHEMK
ncbi:heat shock 70 kDa protein-like [Contarinia nasturtii]|uniref:heat shock 70 kDa protein-like n=1 Tax=Contarinia nasturtii TaxID=265458 RepID=UPI0012D43E74|nr:heat shock 70 kDa protein-like [Contarinia nasturtii]